jgi:hypothetical protein
MKVSNQDEKTKKEGGVTLTGRDQKNERSDTRHLFSFHIIILSPPSIGQIPERTALWQTMK